MRVCLGLLQGALLYALHHSVNAPNLPTWPATVPQLFGPLLMLAVFIPLLGISAWGRMSPRRWWQWMAVALVVVAALSWHDLWRMNPLGEGWRAQEGPSRYPSFQAWAFISAGLFMAHALVLASAHDGRRVAAYPTYFDQAWKLGIQHLFSALFVGALWLMLWLGASLFSLIGLKFLDRLLREAWFNIPISTFALAWALHLTDVKPEIVRGIRGLILVLMSWILPVVAVLATGFLLSLPFTGLQPLWATRNATSVLLITAAALVALINTAFQSGERSDQIHRAVRLSARLACVLLLPLVGLAVHALWLRVSQYGWSGDRVIACACLVVAGGYALGYAWAAVCRGGAWLGPVAWVNVRVTWVILAVLVALFSPLADPSRLAVADQVARLRDGRIQVSQMDFRYLRYDAGRHGHNALQTMVKGQAGMSSAKAGDVARHAQAALDLKHEDRWEHDLPLVTLNATDIRANIKAVWPVGAQLPEGFWQSQWRDSDGRSMAWRLPRCMSQTGFACEAVLLQVDDDAALEVLVLQPQAPSAAVLFDQAADAQGQLRWRMVTSLPTWVATCESQRARLRQGQFSTLAPRYKDLNLGGRRVPIQSNDNWDDAPAQPGPAAKEAGCP
jgi:hypothetical protein